MLWLIDEADPPLPPLACADSGDEIAATMASTNSKRIADVPYNWGIVTLILAPVNNGQEHGEHEHAAIIHSDYCVGACAADIRASQEWRRLKNSKRLKNYSRFCNRRK